MGNIGLYPGSPVRKNCLASDESGAAVAELVELGGRRHLGEFRAQQGQAVPDPTRPSAHDARKEPKSRIMLEVETMAAMIADAAKRKKARNTVLRRQTELALTGLLGLVACAKCILLARSPESPMGRPPSSKESWPHEQFCQSAFDPSKAVVAQGTPRAAMSDLGQTQPMDSVPVPPDVRCCSKSDHLRRECEMTLRANRRHPRCGRAHPYSITSSASSSID